MRRWFVVLLLVVVQAQLAWAAAAPYCKHETNPAAADHVGHHEHRHDAGPGSASTDDGSRWGDTLDADCAFCHLGASAAVFGTVASVSLAPEPAFGCERAPAYVSHVPAPPERPDRASPTAAVRFGDGAALLA